LQAQLKYRVILERDEDGIFIAEVPSLLGCISQGKTRSEAEKIFRKRLKFILKA